MANRNLCYVLAQGTGTKGTAVLCAVGDYTAVFRKPEAKAHQSRRGCPIHRSSRRVLVLCFSFPFIVAVRGKKAGRQGSARARVWILISISVSHPGEADRNVLLAVLWRGRLGEAMTPPAISHMHELRNRFPRSSDEVAPAILNVTSQETLSHNHPATLLLGS